MGPLRAISIRWRLAGAAGLERDVERIVTTTAR